MHWNKIITSYQYMIRWLDSKPKEEAIHHTGRLLHSRSNWNVKTGIPEKNWANCETLRLLLYLRLEKILGFSKTEGPANEITLSWWGSVSSLMQSRFIRFDRVTDCHDDGLRLNSFPGRESNTSLSEYITSRKVPKKRKLHKDQYHWTKRRTASGIVLRNQW